MKLKLYISKNYISSRYCDTSFSKPNHVRFAVLDLDISGKYPVNFVCVLPRNINLKTKTQTQFSTRFKEDSQGIAVKLLKEALKKEKDEDLIREIKDRLKVLNPKPKTIGICNRCSKEFYPRKFGYSIQKICNDCWSKL